MLLRVTLPVIQGEFDSSRGKL